MLHFSSFFWPKTSTTWVFTASPRRPVTPWIRSGAGCPLVISPSRNHTLRPAIGSAITLRSSPRISTAVTVTPSGRVVRDGSALTLRGRDATVIGSRLRDPTHWYLPAGRRVAYLSDR